MRYGMGITYSIDVILAAHRALEFLEEENGNWVEENDLKQKLIKAKLFSYIVKSHVGYIFDDMVNYLVLECDMSIREKDGKVFYRIK